MKSLSVKLGIILIGLAIFVYGEVLGQEKYLCTPDLSTGFRYNNNSKEWEQANFKTDHKYIISKSGDKNYVFQIIKIGMSYPICYCEQGFNEGGFLLCSGLGGIFRFNKKMEDIY